VAATADIPGCVNQTCTGDTEVIIVPQGPFHETQHECAAEKKTSEKFQPRLQLVPHTRTAVKHEQGDRYRLNTNVLPGVDIQFVYVKK